MSTETIAGAIAASSTGVTLATYFPEATPQVMICSLAGAALYVLSSKDHERWKQAVFAMISFIGGVYCSETAADIIAAVINAGLSHVDPSARIRVSPAIGALAASTVSVTVLLRVLHRSKTGSLPGLDSNSKEDKP
ncbi:putative holin [Trabulsiella odontotermitis]|uniref:putative holin n=1 Tax=Trabulsiella odontotermitis TaxID=379893 RepID=UPI000676B0C5|nr:putative holin [Trabulsiella odontotermitis]KNC89855.1 hypothetical protein GM30_05685 [Trabulsiella odontotermitis]